MMMAVLGSLAIFIVVLVYMHAYFSLFGIVAKERPEWVRKRGSFSFMYDGFPRAMDPNVLGTMFRIAFGARAAQLQSADAMRYVKRIRFLLPTFLVSFVMLLARDIL